MWEQTSCFRSESVAQRHLLAGDNLHDDAAVMPLTDRSTSVGGETYSDGFETISEDEMPEAKPVTEARLLPAAQLGYTWTWHDIRFMLVVDFSYKYMCESEFNVDGVYI